MEDGTVALGAHKLFLGTDGKIVLSKDSTLDLSSATITDWSILNKVTGADASTGDVGTVWLKPSTSSSAFEVWDATPVDLQAHYKVQGDLFLNAWRSNIPVEWLVSGSLEVDGTLQLTSKMGLVIKDGATVSASSLMLGHGNGGNPGTLIMEGGTLKTGVITLNNNNIANVLNIRGGTVEFANNLPEGNVFVNKVNDGSVSIANALLTGSTWKLNHDMVLGEGVRLAATESGTVGADGVTITLGGTLLNTGAAGIPSSLLARGRRIPLSG